ncbi:sugar ABC transporter substrate-binding protein [Streptomyces sp. NPDC004065]|uniref:sugar ABC transporter substrate-binding protein n=1 Tax=Streptomyces sp. NPDC004065 TaxID=3364689 RepID=UPI00384EC9B9
MIRPVARRALDRSRPALVAAVLAALALSACSASKDSAGNRQSAPGAAKFAAKARADVTAATARQTSVTDPVRSSGPRPVRDKSIVVIPCSMSVEGCARPARSTVAAARAIGWTARIDDPASDVTKMSAAIQRAISSRADGIVLTSIDAAAVQNDLKAARKAGIAVVCNMCGNAGNLYQAVVPPLDENERAGYLLGEFAYVEARKRFNAPPKFVIMTDDEFETVKARTRGIKKFIADCKAAGAGCRTVAEGSHLASEISTVAPGRVVQLVRSHPDYNVLFAGFDAALNFFAKGLQQAGLAQPGKAFGVSVDADVANTQMIRTGGYQAAAVGFAFARAGYAHVDNLNRIFQGQQPVDQGLRGKLIIKEDVPSNGKAWEGDFDAGALYRKTWGLK